MKTRNLLLPIIATALIVLTSCGQGGGIGPSQTDNGKHKVANLNGGNHNEGLLTYTNAKPLKPAYNGGGVNSEDPNVKDIKKLDYNYCDVGNNHYYPGLDYMPSTGEVNLLVIPVKFVDVDTGVTEKIRQRIYKAYFGTEEDTGYESVSSYFYKSSYGSLKISGVVSDWYECDWSSKIYSEKEVSQLTKEAFEWYKRKYNTKGTEFDSDRDGFIDGICLIYNAPQKTKPMDNDNLWAYCYWVQEENQKGIKNPIPNAFFWASYSFMKPRSAETEMNPIEIDSHTFIHELGHVMGLEDYYTYEELVEDPLDPRSPIYRPGCTGGFLMQDNNVGDHDPFSKMAFGWTKPTLVAGSATVELSSFTETGQVLIIKPDNEFHTPFGEYLALEFYTPTNLNHHDTLFEIEPGFAQGSMVPGIRLWHVDSSLIKVGINQEDFDTFELTGDVESGSCYRIANSNTANGSRASVVPMFRDYKIIHALQKGGINTYIQGELMDRRGKDFWQEGDTFTFKDYRTFFENVDKDGKPAFNHGPAPKASFKVTSMTSTKATIEVTM